MSISVGDSSTPIYPNSVLVVAQVFNDRAGTVPLLGNLAGSVLVLDQNSLTETEWSKVPGVFAPAF